MVHASRGRLDPAATGAAVRGARSSAGWPAPSSAPRSAVPWEEFEADYDRIRDRISRVVPGFEDFNTKVRAARRLRPAARPARQPHASPPRPARPTSPSTPVEHPEAARGPAAAADAALARPVQHHDLRPRRPLPRHQGRPPGGPGPPRRRRRARPRRRRPRRPGRRVDGRRGAARADGFRVVHYPTARGCAAAYYPETNVLVPLDRTADTSNTPTSKSVVIRLEPTAG